MSTTVPYLGSKISLISRSEIRYEGILYTIDQKESTVALAKVRSYGTEDRPTDRPVAPRDEVYEYIIFRGPDIKDIRVCHPPKPQPTLEGGLPNDPAIVQHSAIGGLHLGIGEVVHAGHGEVQSSYRVKGNQGPGASGFDLGGVVSRQPRRQQSGDSPVMDLFRGGTRSMGTSPPSRGQYRMIQGSQRRGGGQGWHQSFAPRGQAVPHQRGGGRGRGGSGGYPSTGRGGSNGYGTGRRGGFVGGRSDPQPGRPQPRRQATSKEKLKFANDYDFEQANEQFKEFLSKFEKASLGDDETPAGSDPVLPGEVGKGSVGNSDKEVQPALPFYDKTKSFFDTISCEASERSKGKSTKPDWKAEKKLNKETFGETVVAQGRHRGYNNRGYGRTNNYVPKRGGDGNNPLYRSNQRNGYNPGYNAYPSAVVFDSRFSRENGTFQPNRGRSQRGGMRRGQALGPWVGVY